MNPCAPCAGVQVGEAQALLRCEMQVGHVLTRNKVLRRILTSV